MFVGPPVAFPGDSWFPPGVDFGGDCRRHGLDRVGRGRFPGGRSRWLLPGRRPAEVRRVQPPRSKLCGRPSSSPARQSSMRREKKRGVRRQALPVPDFRLRVMGGGAAGPEAEPPPCRDFQTRTMASCWWRWRWRRGCSWRPAARSPGPNSAGRAALSAPRAAAAAATIAVARAQVRSGSACRGRPQRSRRQ